MSFVSAFLKTALQLDIAKGTSEVRNTPEERMEANTARTWTARAIGAYRLARQAKDHQKFELLNRGDDLKHEALEHGALALDNGKLVGQLQRVMDKERKEAHPEGIGKCASFLPFFLKTALHNSFIDETESVMADGRPIPKGIETELTEKPGWVKGKRRRKLDRVLRENPVDKTAESKHPRVSQPLHSSFAVQCGEPMTEPVKPKVKSNTRKAARAAGMLNTQLKPETVNSDSGGTYLGSTAGDRLP